MIVAEKTQTTDNPHAPDVGPKTHWLMRLCGMLV